MKMFFLLLLTVSLSASEELYRLHMGDQFEIAVYGEPGSKRTLTVDTNGAIHYLSSLQAIDKTIPELRTALEEQLKSHYKYPVVMITPVRLQGESYTLMGEKKPLNGNPTLLSALCECGNVDLDHSFLLRNRQYVPINFRQLVQEGDLSQDVALQAGDHIVTTVSGNIYVLGKELREVEAHTLSEVTNERVMVIRGPLASPHWFLIEAGQGGDFALIPGDIVYVPPKQLSHPKEMLQAGIDSFILYFTM